MSPAGWGGLGEGADVTRDIGEGRGVRRRDLPLARIEEALAAHDEALAKDDDRVAKRGRKSSVTCHGDLVVKEHVPFGRLGPIKDCLAPRRHAAGYRNAGRLLRLGVATARPLAWFRRGRRVFTLYEDLSRLSRLDHVARRTYAEGEPSARVRLRDAVADWLAALHVQGVHHGDLKGSNVLIEDDGERIDLLLIDTDRVRFSASPVDSRRRARNLAQLAASIPVSVTRSERLRFYRRYAAAAHPTRSERRMARDVQVLLAQKILVVDEPIE